MTQNAVDHGFTLIELLAVIVIASLVVAMGGLSISAAADRSTLVRTIAALQQMDARARLHARTAGESMVLHIDAESRSLRLTTVDGQLLPSVDIPTAIEMTIEKVNREPTIVFDTRGRSVDYAIVLRGGSTGSITRLSVHGLTGEIAVTEVDS